MAIIQERREVSDFDEVHLEGSGTIILEQGEQDGLIIEADENLLPRIKSEVVEGRLRLGFKSWLDYLTHAGHPPIHYRVTMRQVHGVSVSGSGRLQAGPIQTDRMRLKVSGAGDLALPELHASDLETSLSGTAKVTVGGAVQRQEISISGSGELNADQLACEEVRIRISGSGKVCVQAAQKLDVGISGAGDVRYIGQPRISHHISGSGKIQAI